jgi:hypothetical protein
MFNKGYKGVNYYYAKVLLPYLKNRNLRTPFEEKLDNDLAAIHTVIENINCEIKKYYICSSVFKAHTNNLKCVKQKHIKI